MQLAPKPKLQSIRYPFARSADGAAMFIDHYEAGPVTCFGCDRPLIAKAKKAGAKRRPHFAHGVDVDVTCNAETALHRLSKALIQEPQRGMGRSGRANRHALEAVAGVERQGRGDLAAKARGSATTLTTRCGSPGPCSASLTRQVLRHVPGSCVDPAPLMLENPRIMDVAGFFSGLVGHFRERREFVQSLAVMAAIEHWFQMEAAAFADIHRGEFGIGGGDPKTPTWWVTCEHKKVDLWIQEGDGTSGVAIEFKAIHNNKNFKTKLYEVRRDLSDSKLLPSFTDVRRFSILVATFASYIEGASGNYVRDRSLEALKFREHIERQLESTDAYYEALPSAQVIGWEQICDLEKSAYISPGEHSAVWLGLAKRAS